MRNPYKKFKRQVFDPENLPKNFWQDLEFWQDSAFQARALGEVYQVWKEMIKNKNVVLVEDSPSITHGGVSSNYTASKLAAKKYKSKNIINPRRYGVGSLKEVFKDYPNLDIIPTTGYGKSQINDLIETINNVKADSIIFASYCSLFMKNRFNKPLTRVTYELEEIGKPKLDKIIFNFLKNRIH